MARSDSDFWQAVTTRHSRWRLQPKRGSLHYGVSDALLDGSSGNVNGQTDNDTLYGGATK